MDGLTEFTLNGRAERQARRAARKGRRDERKDARSRRREARTVRQETRGDRKAERQAKRGEFLEKIGDSAKGFIENKAAEFGLDTSQLLPGGSNVSFDYAEDFAEEKGLFGPPSLFKDPGKWFSSNKVPTWQKAALIGGVVVGIDAATGGNIILQKAGIMKKKRK